jgi:hypothetical protein
VTDGPIGSRRDALFRQKVIVLLFCISWAIASSSAIVVQIAAASAMSRPGLRQITTSLNTP